MVTPGTPRAYLRSDLLDEAGSLPLLRDCFKHGDFIAVAARIAFVHDAVRRLDPRD